METPSPAQDIQPAPAPPPKPKNILVIILGILVVILLGLSLFLAYQNSQFKARLTVRPEPEPTRFQPTPLATPTPDFTTPTPILDPTAGWQIYRNDRLKWLIKHPQDWVMRILVDTPIAHKQSVEFKGYPSSSYPALIYVRVSENMIGAFPSLREWMVETLHGEVYARGQYKGVPIPEKSNFELAGHPAFRMRIPGGQTDDEIAIFALRGDDIFEISYSPADNGLYEENCEELLSTFEFLD